MRRYLIDPNVITHSGTISEDELKARLVSEALEQAGWLDAEGLPLKGVTSSIYRGDGRRGGYRVQISRDLRLSDQARIAPPAQKG